jgi:hypothetical protein
MKTKYLLIQVLAISLLACQKRDIAVQPVQLPAISNLVYTLSGDTVVLSWAMPAGFDNLVPVLGDGASTKDLTVNASSYKYGIIETNKEYTYVVKVKDSKGNISLGEIVKFKRDGATAVKDVTGEQNENGVLLKWNLPADPITKITIKFGSQTIDLPGTATSCQVNNVPVGAYNISFVTSNTAGLASNTVYLPFKVGATAVAYLGKYSDSSSLLSEGDDDEIAGAKWLFANYNKSRYISFDQIKNGSVDLSQFRVLWWNYDLETTKDLPAVATDAIVVNKIKTYYQNGGGLLFNQYAVQYFWTLGRFTEPYFMGFDQGAGFSNPDVWGIGVKINRKHDFSTHPLYKGITMTTQGDGRVTFPVIGSGWKENHNAVILRIPEYVKLEPNDNEAAYNKFVTDNNLEWLGQWDGIGDYWMAGVMELKPKEAFLGSAIYIGIGGIEWKQNFGTNVYQSNIERLYRNAIDYLKTK